MEKLITSEEQDDLGTKRRIVPRRLASVVSLFLVVGGVAVVWRAAPLLHTATASVSLSVANGVFVSGLDPAQVYREEQLPNPGMSKLAWALHYTVDHEHKEVYSTILGGFESHAVYREGFGCHLVQPTSPVGINWATPNASGTVTANKAPPLVEAIDARLSPALDAAFAEVDARKLRQTKAVVVLHDGKLVAERYAPGYGVDTPLWGHSLTKSVTSALIGILVREGKLKIDQPRSVAAWRSLNDPRRAITVDHLLRMDAGQPPDETDGVFTLATRMWFLGPDSVAFVSRQPLATAPGTHWAYGNLPYALLSGVVREVAGGEPSQTLAFIRRELFEPVGMGHATLEFDSAGTPMGNGFMYAPARDWARFGQLYLDDGMVGGGASCRKDGSNTARRPRSTRATARAGGPIGRGTARSRTGASHGGCRSCPTTRTSGAGRWASSSSSCHPRVWWWCASA